MENLKNCLFIVFLICGIMCFLNMIFYFAIKIDESKILEMRYCYNCGIDLTNRE